MLDVIIRMATEAIAKKRKKGTRNISLNITKRGSSAECLHPLNH